MRKSLANSFDEISILDLHGNSLIIEESSGEIKDENIFDIRQGVSLFIGCKQEKQSHKQEPIIYFDEIYGKKQQKYNFLSKNDVLSTKWQKLNPKDSDFFFFCHKNFSLKTEYEEQVTIKEIFISYTSGMQTKRDRLIYKFRRDDLDDLENNFCNRESVWWQSGRFEPG